MKTLSKSKIDWPGLTHTWNPIIGCKNNCNYCIAKQWNDRYNWIKQWDVPEYFPNKLVLPFDTWKTKNAKIFVVFLGDLFGDWVNSDYINGIIRICEHNERHEFLFLTKNSVRYNEFIFPNNCVLGVTITGCESFGKQHQLLSDLTNAYIKNNFRVKTFLSIEPLLGKIIKPLPKFLTHVIVGAQTGKNKITIPHTEWINEIKHENIYYKSNIKKYLSINK